MKESAHFRRCHMCGHVNCVANSPTSHCEKCSKSLAPFYYFDDRLTAVVSDGLLRPPLISGQYGPILGLTVFWEQP